MKQEERLQWLIEYLLQENGDHQKMPSSEQERKQLLRALMNIRMPSQINEKFLEIQDEYLSEELSKKTVASLKDIRSLDDHIYLWKGDITTLDVDAIVNAANSSLLGCFVPGHACIDNAIHSAAGLQLRFACNEIMMKQGKKEPTGTSKITFAYNLPCRYVIHTVGPIIQNEVTQKDCDLLESCYTSCLNLATDHDVKSIAFCCISTGEFHFPNELAAEIAVHSVKKFLNDHEMDVIFNVFKEVDYDIYRRLLNAD